MGRDRPGTRGQQGRRPRTGERRARYRTDEKGLRVTLQLSDKAKALLDAKSFPTVATLLPDGSPQLTVMWVKRDGDDVLLSTVEGRRKQLNLAKDGRVSVLICPPESPYTYVEIRGRAVLTREGGAELIQELSQKYTGGPYANDGPDDVRVVIRIVPTKIIDAL
jgi:PPOX class probable F420-dependent enzyme